MTLHVVWAEPPASRTGRAGIQDSRRLAHASRRAAAADAAAPQLGFLTKDDGAPRPEAGWHWSITNTRGLVAALVAPTPIGIDAEWLGRPRLDAARERFRSSGELAQLGADDAEAVLSLWTAKEAVLKLTGVGIADLGRVPLRSVVDARTLVLAHRDRSYRIRLLQVAEHLLAVACELDAFDVVAAPLPTCVELDAVR